MNTSPGPKLVFFTLVNGLNQSMLRPRSDQKAVGSAIAFSYQTLYFGWSTQARRPHSGETGRPSRDGLSHGELIAGHWPLPQRLIGIPCGRLFVTSPSAFPAKACASA